jgi:hypothetical protein
MNSTNILPTETNSTLPDKWMTYAKKYNFFIVIPKDSLIYRGVKSEKKYIDKQKYTFYSDFNAACWYAFSSDFQNGEKGKVICMKLKHDVVLLDMDNINTFQLLYQYGNVPDFCNDQDVIQYAFGYNHKKPIDQQVLKRCSHNDIDKKFCNWLVNIVKNNNINVDGYGFFGSKHFHNEIMLFNDASSKNLELMPIEYRFVIDYVKNTVKNYYVLEIYNGKLVRSIIDESIILFNGSKLRIRWNCNNIYEPDINRVMDAFYFNNIYGACFEIVN